MPPLGPIKRHKFIHYLHQLGWTGPHPGTHHQKMTNGVQVIILPNPHQGDIGSTLLVRLLQQGGISRAAWEAL